MGVSGPLGPREQAKLSRLVNPAMPTKPFAGEEAGVCLVLSRLSRILRWAELLGDRMTATRKTFKIGDRVRWNSEAGRVSGVVIKKITSDTRYKGYVHHASWKAPQYLIESDKTEHVAIHKGTALRLTRALSTKSSENQGTKEKNKQ